jgi:hypothetical protein
MKRTLANRSDYFANWLKMANSTHPHLWQGYIASGKTLKTFLGAKWRRYARRYSRV